MDLNPIRTAGRGIRRVPRLLASALVERLAVPWDQGYIPSSGDELVEVSPEVGQLYGVVPDVQGRYRAPRSALAGDIGGSASAPPPRTQPPTIRRPTRLALALVDALQAGIAAAATPNIRTPRPWSWGTNRARALQRLQRSGW